MADINQQVSVVQPPVPIQWTWIAQRQQSDGKANSIWKFGFIAPDGAEVRVTFHQVGDVQQYQQQKAEAKQAEASQQMQMGMPPSPDPTGFSPEGQPNTDQAQDATFYVTFFSNRQPEFFMKWDTSLSHDDSLVVWITITHGIIDFVRKASPANVILDDLANGKLKMVLRSVAMDIAASNPGYELEQTQKHHYRSFFQVKKTGTQSAFDNSVSGQNSEGETEMPKQATPVTGGQAQVQAQAQQMGAGSGDNPKAIAHNPGEADMTVANADPDSVNDDKGQDPTQPQPEESEKPAFQSAEPVPIKQTSPLKKGYTVEIGKDYSIAVKDRNGNAVDRYRAKNPADIIRWINDKGYAANKMKIVDREQVSGERFQGHNATTQAESFVINGKTVLVKVNNIPASDAAVMNSIVNAVAVRRVNEGLKFEFDTDRDMHFKKALVELAAKEVGVI